MLSLLTNRYVLGALGVLGVVVALLGYRSHLIDMGAAQEAQAAATRQAVAVAAVRASDAAVTASVTTDLNQKLIRQQERHDRITDDLQAALAASDLRASRLDARIAGLLDHAAGIRPRTAAASSGTGPAARAPQGDQAVAAAGDASIADLIESVDANYEICQRNATRLGALQKWYSDIRAGREIANP
ncbi:hypothetical protein QTI51_09540 [Variovorax sp. J22G73]|uniref:hypothetical protein n=1 Tax=unclassified Variovorax TaxID=663243 RepID=UPI002576F4DD|nr:MULTISPECIES: hypothetical protein [unclassified Variovorax]MDM0006458.1 hypothetical protein [Variovorax sp. J22R203]MDM0097519.1 hypothetical protein [Variovorax sp. J22G73]